MKQTAKAFMAPAHTISIDAMGGDAGPETVLSGLDLLVRETDRVQFLLFGDEATLQSELKNYPAVAARATVIHCLSSIKMDDKPSQALRSGRRHSSMWRSIEAVKEGRASACVSAGNTGALMAMAKICLKTLPEIQRPALAGFWPTIKRDSIVLDMGATIGADSRQLVDFALMGCAMARAVFNEETASIGLLNIGVEEVKGIEPIKEAGGILRSLDLAHMDYQGFVEGNDIGQGIVDVVVTEGFSGNIALKTAEGTVRQVSSYLREAMTHSIFARLGYILAQGAFRQLKQKLDPSRANGAVFLGVNGIVIKSHGSASPRGFANAVDLASRMVDNQLLEKISEEMRSMQNVNLSHQDRLATGTE